jgi:hypothetical protein
VDVIRRRLARRVRPLAQPAIERAGEFARGPVAVGLVDRAGGLPGAR